MRDRWAADGQEFPSLGAQKTAGKAKGSAGPSNTEMDRRPMGHPTRSPEIWTGRCGRLMTFGRFREGTVMLGRGKSRNP